MKILVPPALLYYIQYNCILLVIALFSFYYCNRKFHKVLKKDFEEYDTEITVAKISTALCGICFVVCQLCVVWILIQVLCIIIFTCINLTLHFGTMKK